MATRVSLLAVLGLLLLPLPAASAEPQPELVPGEVVVHFKRDRRPVLTAVAGRRVERVRPIAGDTVVVELDERSAAAVAAGVSALRAHREVAHAEPNLIRRPFVAPNDTHFALQWGLAAAKVDTAWTLTTGSAATVVAVVDTGILAEHPDLLGRTIAGRDFISTTAAAGDGDGWDANPTDSGTDVAQSSGFHGTHVAGIIGAIGNNAKGIAGVDWSCKILSVRALGVDAGKGSDADIAAAIRWAAGLEVAGVPKNPTPARVINLSFGGPGATQVLTDAVVAAMGAGAIVIAAAGNQGTSASNIYPAAIPGVIAVGATKYNGARAAYSNYGSIVAVMAPGGNLAENLPFQHQNQTWPAGILSTLYRTSDKSWGYHLYEGTSQAAPLVAGVVSLMLARDPKLTASKVASILKATANPASKCSEGCGAGLIDASAAVAGVTSSNPTPTPPPSTGSKLPFSSSCQSDDQCVDAVCRELSAGTKVCTRYCTLSGDCPTDATCSNGLCVPTSAPVTNPGQSCPAGQSCATPTTIEGVGCSVAAHGLDAAGWLPLLIVLLGLRRRR